MSSTMSLNLLTNYLPELKETTIELYQYYIALIQTLLNHIHTNITIKNIEYLKYIIKYGINTITHIYKLLLLYTRNVSLTVHHCEKSILFYVEFITQIGDDNHSFLQLTSKDAVMFLYKKTLFELEENYVKTCVHTSQHTDKIHELDLNTTLFTAMIHHNVSYYKDMTSLMKEAVDINSIIHKNRSILITYSSDIVDLIDLLVPYSKSSISSVDKILEYIQSNQCINTLDAFHKITIDQEQHVD